MTDLSSRYLGLEIRSPIVGSASPLWEDLENIRRAEEAGVGAIVLHSLFEEQLAFESRELNRYLVQGSESFAESLSYFPDLEDYGMGPETYLEHISQAKDAVEIPIIASLNGVSDGGWVSHAREMEKAGADAIELNVYYIPTRPGMTSGEVDEMYVRLAASVKEKVKVPVAVKIGPYFSSLPNLAKRLDGEGVDAIVIFNRFYQPDLDLEKLQAVPDLDLSSSQELRLRIRWAAILFGRIKADIAITGGVHSVADVVKSVMAGAKVAMMTSALLKGGIDEIRRANDGLSAWMEGHGYASIGEILGALSQRSIPDPAAFERANYAKVLSSYPPNL